MQISEYTTPDMLSEQVLHSDVPAVLLVLGESLRFLLVTRESLQLDKSLILSASEQFQGTNADVLANRGVRST